MTVTKSAVAASFGTLSPLARGPSYHIGPPPVNQILEAWTPGLNLPYWMRRAEGGASVLFIPVLCGEPNDSQARGETHWLN